MRLTKVIGLAAIAAVTAMAFAGTGSAFGQAHEVVLCKELVTLCPKGKLWPAKTELLLLAGLDKFGNPPTLLGTLNVKCEDSLGTAVTENEIGATLLANLTSFEFGKLPTPKLGEGCTNCKKVHVTVPILGHLEVEAIDKYFLKATGKATLKECLGSLECIFEGKNIKVPITHTGKHAKHPGENLALAEFNEVALTRVGGSPFCGKEGKWDADYALTLAHAPGFESGLAWPSLDTPAINELVLCKTLVEKGKLCPQNEIYVSGTKLLALAENTEFKASPFSAIKCSDSVIEAETTSDMGETYGISITKLEFGKLPTPKLGEGCTTCTGGIHTPTPISGSIEVAGEDDFTLVSSGATELLNCFGLSATCVYAADDLKSLIDNDSGKHKLAPEEKGLAVILVSGTLSYIKGSNFCPEKGTWTASYVVYAVESGGKQTQGWIALYAPL